MTTQEIRQAPLGTRQVQTALVGKWLTVGLLASMLAITGCQKGDPGPAGPDGKNGTDGNNGINGINGKNGVPYDQAIRNGSIITYLDGKTPEGVAFRDTINFKFSSTNLDVSQAIYFSSNDIEFDMERFTSLDNWNIQNNTEFIIEPYDNSGDTTWFVSQYLKVSVATSDFKYFTLDDYYYDGEGSNVSSASYDGFRFDSSTGHLYFRYSWTVPANSNSTGYDLNVSGVADVTVYESEN